MEDHIIIIHRLQHYIRLGDDMDLFIYIFRNICLRFSDCCSFFLFVVQIQCFEHLKKTKPGRILLTKKQTSLSVILHVQRFFFLFFPSSPLLLLFPFSRLILFAQKACLLHHRSFTFIALCVLYFAVSIHINISRCVCVCVDV